MEVSGFDAVLTQQGVSDSVGLSVQRFELMQRLYRVVVSLFRAAKSGEFGMFSFLGDSVDILGRTILFGGFL